MTEDKFTLGNDAIAKLYVLTDMMLESVSDEGLDNLYSDSLSEKYCIKPDFVARDIEDDELLLAFIADSERLPEVIGRISFCVTTLCTVTDFARIVVIVPNESDIYILEMVLSVLDSLSEFAEIHIITQEEYNNIEPRDE